MLLLGTDVPPEVHTHEAWPGWNVFLLQRQSYLLSAVNSPVCHRRAEPPHGCSCARLSTDGLNIELAGLGRAGPTR